MRSAMKLRHLTLPLMAALALSLAACSKEETTGAPSAAGAPAADTSPIPPAQAYDVLAAQGKGFTAGALMSANTVYVLFDPQCPHCGHLWQSSLPLQSKVKFVWLPVAIMNAKSAPQITFSDGRTVAAKLVGVDEAKGKLFFLGTRDDPLAMQLYALDLAHPDKVQALGEAGWNHDASMDKGGQTLLVTRSSPAQPPQVYLADTSGKRIAWVEENRLDAQHPYAPYLASHRAPKFGVIKAADGTELHWKMILPEMQPGKRYPVFFQHYGGPHVQTVNRAWAGALEQAVVGQGYIFFEIDNRGSANRGVSFESAIYRAMGSVEVADQKAGAQYLKTLPYVDPAKIATYGWSYGGYMSVKMLEADQGLYAAAIAGAPVTRWELYDTHYTERYMGTPQADGAAYARSSALPDAGKIKDPLLIIHGMADDNVVFENSSALIARLQGEAVPFEMMFYPGFTHRVSGPRVGPHLWEGIFAFLKRHGVTPP